MKEESVFVGPAVPWWRAALLRTFTNRYNAANVVYLAYALIITFIAYLTERQASAAFPVAPPPPADDPYAYVSIDYYDVSTMAPYTSALALVNRMYIAAATIHVVNAFMYAWVWRGIDEPIAFTSPIMFPEYLNIIESSLYLYSATRYSSITTYGVDAYSTTEALNVHKVEFTAAMVNLAASVGWVLTWWATRTIKPGRGATLDDPDVWANIFIVVPSLIYVAYNAQVNAWPSFYAYDQLYQVGDCMYLAGAVFYVLCGLRDDGWFDALHDLHVPFNLCSALLFVISAAPLYWVVPSDWTAGLNGVGVQVGLLATSVEGQVTAVTTPAFQAAAAFLFMASIIALVACVLGAMPATMRSVVPRSTIFLTAASTLFGFIGVVIAGVEMQGYVSDPSGLTSWPTLPCVETGTCTIWGPALPSAVVGLCIAALNSIACLINVGFFSWVWSVTGLEAATAKISAWDAFIAVLNAAALSLFATGALGTWIRTAPVVSNDDPSAISIPGTSFTLLMTYTDGFMQGLPNSEDPNWLSLQIAAAFLLMAFTVSTVATFCGTLHLVGFLRMPQHAVLALTAVATVFGVIGTAVACALLSAAAATVPYGPPPLTWGAPAYPCAVAGLCISGISLFLQSLHAVQAARAPPPAAKELTLSDVMGAPRTITVN